MRSTTTVDATIQFRATMIDAGLTPPDAIEAGKFYRFPGVGKHNGNTAGWCKMFTDGQGGAFGDWASGLSETWQVKRSKPYTASERSAFQRHVQESRAQAEAEEKAQQAEAATMANVIWEAAKIASDGHPYLEMKGITGHGLRLYDDGRLIVPMKIGGIIHGLQFIAPNAEKRFLTGGRVKGTYYRIDSLAEGAKRDTLCIAEGFATAASIHEATGYPVVVAFNAGNLEAVARTMRTEYPDVRLILCADDDINTEGNPGLTKAKGTALAVKGLYAVPNFGDSRPDGATDFNDLARSQGPDMVRRCIEAAVDSRGALRDSPSLFDSNGKKKSQVTVLIELCEHLVLFHDAESSGYAVIEKPDHCEIWPLQSRAFRNWLGHQYYKLSGKGVRGTAINDALATVEARAQHDAPQRDVFMRVAWLNGRIYIDLADEAWRVVEIDTLGWRLLDRSPVMFTRRTGMAALPMPTPGNLSGLAELVPVSGKDLQIIKGWMLMAARGRGPYPILVVHGEQGSGKSVLTRVLRTLIDPSTVPLRGLNKDLRDLIVAATNNHVVVLDNLSALPREVSDALCRLSTGGGFAERQLYTNKDEVLVNIQRPVILNGIEELATRGDLMERSIIVHLPVIADTARTTESAIWKRYEELRPGLLGGLYTALSGALHQLPTTMLTRKPRMADFALWVTAAENALGWIPGEFMAAYGHNQDAATETALEASPFGEILVQFMDKKLSWSGTATDLLNEIEGLAHERARTSRSWPKSGKGVSNVLRRIAPLLRRTGINIHFGDRTGDRNRRRVIEIDKVAKPLSVSSVPSEKHNINDLGPDDGRTVQTVPGDDPGIVGVSSVKTPHTFEENARADGTDDTFGTLTECVPSDGAEDIAPPSDNQVEMEV